MFARVAICLTLLAVPVATLEAQEKQVFGPTAVHAIHLQLSEREWERMQAVSGGPGFFPLKKPMAKDGEEPYEWHKSPGFNLEFPWAHATLTIDGKIYKNVGVRYKGNGSFTTSGKALKRNLKIEIDHYVEDQRWQGVRTITLNAGAVDASRLREALAYAVYRAAKVPAPQTAFAAVTLTVPDKYDKEFLGLYTFIEHVDKAFLKRHYQDHHGLLMKPERVRGLDYLGDDWKRYQGRYFPKREPTRDEIERIIALATLIAKGDDDAFKKEIGARLDIDNFLRFLAVTTMLPNTDCFMTTGHNYYMYLHPKTNKISFMPWDLDLAFAGFPLMGSVKDQTNMNLLKPFNTKVKLVDRLLAIPEVNDRYRKIVSEIAADAFAKDRLLKEIALMEKAIQAPLEREMKARTARNETPDKFNAWVMGLVDPQPDMRAFVEARTAAVASQVDAMKKAMPK